MAVRVEPGEPRVAALLAREPLGTVAIAGEIVEAAAHGERLEVWLDDGDRPEGLLTCGRWVRLYASGRAALERLVPAIPERSRFGEQQGELGFAAVPAWIHDLVVARWQRTWHHPCWLYCLERPADLRAEADGHDVRPLGPEHADLVNRHWDLGEGDAESAAYVRERLVRGPGAAVFDDGRPVSWSLTHGDGQMGFMFTLPEARGRGHAMAVTAALSREIIARGRVPYLFTFHHNAPAQRLAEAAGFRRQGDFRWFGARRTGAAHGGGSELR